MLCLPKEGRSCGKAISDGAILLNKHFETHPKIATSTVCGELRPKPKASAMRCAKAAYRERLAGSMDSPPEHDVLPKTWKEARCEMRILSLGLSQLTTLRPVS
jgi:hypothetical protein